MNTNKFIPFNNFTSHSSGEMVTQSKLFNEEMQTRRSVRMFSELKIDLEIIQNCIRTAGSAPSGANQQPWYFVIVSDPKIKKEIRIAAEAEEKEFYSSRAPKEWLEAIGHLGTNENKPFLETAPYLIVIFEEKYDEDLKGRKKYYYTKESVGIATGFLITAIHHAGLVSLTHTPSPMNFLNQILNRPSNEKPFLILVVGLPAENCTIPDIEKKRLEEISTFV